MVGFLTFGGRSYGGGTRRRGRNRKAGRYRLTQEKTSACRMEGIATGLHGREMSLYNSSDHHVNVLS